MVHVTLRQIEAFRHLMESRTMTGAAERMSISQPAISRLIADLEATLELQLFERSGPRLRATTAALRLVSEVERVFLGLDHVEAAARRIRRFPSDPYRIAAPPFLSSGFMARLVARVTADLPDLTVSLHTDTSHAIAEQVSRGEHDFGLCTLATSVQDVTVAHRVTIGTDCVVPADHPLAAKAVIREVDLDGERIFVLGRSGAIRPQINSVFERANIQMRIVGEVLHASSCASFVAEGLGIALMNTISARTSVVAGTRIVPFSPAITQDFSAIVPKRDKFADVTEAFLSHLPGVVDDFT